MRIVVCVALAGLGLLFTSEQASAQYPSYGGSGYGHGGHYSHHDHHYAAPPQPYVQGYGSGLPSYGYGNSLPSGYGGGIAYPQYNTPQVSSYYSNNYYGRPAHSHHSWHLGHYLSGHH
jgi:hypothetical protein